MDRLHGIFKKYVQGKIFSLEVTIMAPSLIYYPKNTKVSIGGCVEFKTSEDFANYLLGMMFIPSKSKDSTINIVLFSGNLQRNLIKILSKITDRVYIVHEDTDDILIIPNDDLQRILDDPSLLKYIGAAESMNVSQLVVKTSAPLHVLNDPPTYFREGLAEYERLVEDKFVAIRR